MKKYAKAFIRAAELLDINGPTEFSCLAILEAVEGNGLASEVPEVQYFKNLYLDDAVDLGAHPCVFFANWNDPRRGSFNGVIREHVRIEERRHRIFALLLAAEIAKGGGLYEP